MKSFAVFLVIFILAGIMDAFASGTGAAALGSDLKADEKKGILNSLGVKDNMMQVNVTYDDCRKYMPEDTDDSFMDSKSVVSAYVEKMPQGFGINVESSNIACVTKEMITEALITAGIKDVNVKIASPYSVSGGACLVPVVMAYEKLTGESMPDEDIKAACEEIVIMGEMGLKLGMKKSVQFMNEIEKETVANPSTGIESIKVIVEDEQKRFNITLDKENTSRIVNLMAKVNKTGLKPDVLKEQQKNISQYLDNLSKTAYRHSLLKIIFDRLMIFFKRVSRIFKR